MKTLYVELYMAGLFLPNCKPDAGQPPIDNRHGFPRILRTLMTRDTILTGLLICLASMLAIKPSPAIARPYAGFSGLAAAADSALTAGTNPAGITRFKKPAYQVEALAFFNRSTWEGELGDSGQTSRSSESGETFIPSGYLIQPINDDFSFSFTLLGMGFSDDLGDWPGKYFITSYESVNVSAFPSIAYRVNDKLSVAASLTLSYAMFNQEKAIANLFDPGYADGFAELETDGIDTGFSISMLYEITPKTRWGLVYMSEVDPTMDGKVKYQGLGPNTEAVLEEAGLLGTKVEVRSRTPQSILAGVYHEFSNRHALTADLAWSDFSRFKLSEFYFNGETLAENEANYQDIYALSVGYSWPLNPRWMLGVAGMYVDDMIEDDQRTMTLRLDSIWSLGVAAEWQWKEGRKLQLGLSYLDLGDAPVSTPEIPGIGAVTGKFTNREAILLRVGLAFGSL